MVAFLRSTVALVLILQTLHSSAGEGEGIEKVSYLLQYGPGVHTVFEVAPNPSDKPVVSTGSSTGPSSALHQPRSTTMRSDLNTVTIGAAEASVASSAPQGAANAAHRLESVTDDGSPSSSTGEGPSVTEGAIALTTAHAAGLMNTATSIVSSASTYLSSSLDPQKGSQDDGAATGAGSKRPSTVGATVNRLPTLLPPPPMLPAYGSMLHTDVMVNLKPKELRALMSTYITLIETYKSFNQQQRRNIAWLTKVLQSLEQDQLRAGTWTE
uniref:DUF4485 domain-containing protein n=1 Tax=Anopheles albimanus TaxID=7167 RepID=A0A182FGI6_ANOAL